MGIWITRDGKSYGPYEEQQIKLWIDAGTISNEDMALREGGTSWIPLKQILSLDKNNADDWIETFSSKKSVPYVKNPSIVSSESSSSSFVKLFKALAILILVIAIGVVFGIVIDKIPI